ncbi:META domain-containing protein [Psychrobacter lutiphocae]|uniref:META domain-containing protein n=1 Tax=Psychrobacter lutiphocae TaxID=540500 RepID=UPI00037DD5B6|nr:DUF4377 domain-containing protein [Psychrobacter lutiphocae]
MLTLRTLSVATFATFITLTGCHQTIPSEQKTIPSEQKTMPSEQKAMPSEQKTMPSQHTDKGINHSVEAARQINNSVLAAYDWQLLKATDSQNRPIDALNKIKQQVTASFGEQSNGYGIGFGVGCNSMGASYTLQSNVMQVGDIISTMMLCQELDAAEKQLAQLMDGRSQLSLTVTDNPVLTQKTENGSTLVWQGQQTPETRYGHKGDTVFWQIDHQLQPCPNPDDGTTCLKVREVFYDAQGIKTSVGDWQLIVEPIEGYQHDSGLVQVLRLKRFTVDPVDVKGKQYAYVLDRVVESAIVDAKD